MRILFGTNSWPCGVLDLGSYLASQRLAEIRIAPVIPGAFDQLGSGFRKIMADFRPDFIGLRIEGGMFELVCEQIRAIREIPGIKIKALHRFRIDADECFEQRPEKGIAA